MFEAAKSERNLFLKKFTIEERKEVVFSLTIHHYLSWKLWYHDKPLGPDTASVLKNTPPTLCSPCVVVSLLQMLDTCHTCVGNPDISLSHSIFMDPTVSEPLANPLIYGCNEKLHFESSN